MLNFPELHCLSWGVDFSVSAVVVLMYVEFSGGRGSSGSCCVPCVMVVLFLNLELVQKLLLLLVLLLLLLLFGWYSSGVVLFVDVSSVLCLLLSLVVSFRSSRCIIVLLYLHGAHLAASFDVVADISVPTVGMYSGCTGDFSWLKLEVSEIGFVV